MAKLPHLASHDATVQEGVVLVRRDDQTSLVALELDNQLTRERAVARLRVLWLQRTFLFRFSVFGLIISAIIAYSIPNRYTSTARLMPPDNNSSSGLASVAAALSGASSGIGSIASGFLDVKSNSDIFVAILGSRTAEDNLIQKFDLKKIYGDRRLEDARKDLAGQTSISIDRKSQIVTIEVTDRNPQRAAAMAQSYVEELNRLVAEMSTSSARRERVFLEGRLQGVSRDLETAEKSFSQFASKNTAIDISAQGRAMVEAAATLQGELIAARSELEGLKQIYSDNNVHVRSVAARVDALQSQLEKVIGKGDVTSDAPGPGGESTYPSIRKLPLLGVSYADLFRNTKVQEAVFETLTKEYEMAKVQEAKEIPTVKVLDPANIPERKSFPPRLLFMFLGTSLACFCGILFVFVSAGWKAISPQDPEKVFATEIFAQINGLSANGSENASISRQIARGIQRGFGWQK